LTRDEQRQIAMRDIRIGEGAARYPSLDLFPIDAKAIAATRGVDLQCMRLAGAGVGIVALPQRVTCVGIAVAVLAYLVDAVARNDQSIAERASA
jgi:hypothetical protein